MKLRDKKNGARIPLLAMATLAGAGCSQSPDSPAASAQAASQRGDGGLQPVADAPAAGKTTAEPTTGTNSFVFKADKPLKSVSVVGTFNGWDKTANPMKVDGDGVTWRLTLPLTYGKYVYKFAQFKADGSEEWVVDPSAPLDETDKVNDNSVLLVTPADYKIPASPNDGKTASSVLLALTGARDIGYDGEKVILSLRARPGDLRQVTLKSSGARYPMKLVRRDDLYAYYKAAAPWNRKQDLTYNFELADGKNVKEYGAGGLGLKSQPFKIAAKGFQPYLLTDAPEPLRMNGPLTTQKVFGPSWAKNQPIYEVNLDVYKFPKGTAIREFEKHLPTLKKMGIGIVWFMPLHPRGYKKGFGSPYAVRDYADINPDLGTKAEFKNLVGRAHELGLHVLMDWVPNHTSWDNALIEAHPEFYVKDAKGEISQASVWPDVAQLDYGSTGKWNQPLWNQMRDDMTMWVRDYGVDGFRCDVAGSNGKVPAEFWQWLRPQLNAIKPVFMLAEADNVEVFPAFDMAYSWVLPPVMWDICAGRKPASAIDDALRQEAAKFPAGAVQMRFVDNHDWHAHADWDWGKRPAIDTKNGLAQVAPLMVLCATLPGKPLIYNGQEMSFLKVDPPAQAEARTQSPVWPFYSALTELYRSQPAIVEGSFAKIASDHDDKIYAFTRQRGQDRVLVVVNLSDQSQVATLKSVALSGNYRDWFGKSDVKLSAAPAVKLAPWAYRVYVSRAKE
ncbi:1,4-alpha-glucan branching enzyme [Abditibacterium utsteinense]|uniref:1,4-alpha-glucan branching enzyme n=1 Tax=Abditibacterium utsteinense TaxID=1960156 RepID=A0A2S8SQ90_9BACT|nr:alpha-amylase family glycosyl hydrolase [Abditibacterium utsteinense]PQV62929.1 1,4-alpha-glucan branching enzyme [Abditibacterium utsteinense]